MTIVVSKARGEPMVAAFLRSRHEPIVLVYHNITPAKYFAPYDPNFAALLATGHGVATSQADRARAAPHVGDVGVTSRGAPEGRAGKARAFDDRRHVEHLQPRDGRNAARSSGEGFGPYLRPVTNL